MLVASFENSMDLVSDVRGRDFFFFWGLDVPNNGPFEFDPHVNNNQNDNNSDDSVNRDVYQPRLNLVTIFFFPTINSSKNAGSPIGTLTLFAEYLPVTTLY